MDNFWNGLCADSLFSRKYVNSLFYSVTCLLQPNIIHFEDIA